jgi:hypothetical protein
VLIPDESRDQSTGKQTRKRQPAGGGNKNVVEGKEKDKGGDNREGDQSRDQTQWTWMKEQMEAVVRSKEDVVISKDQLIKELKADKEFLQKEKSVAEEKVQFLNTSMYTQGLNPSFNEDYTNCQKNLKDMRIKRMEGMFLFYFIFLSFILN